MQKMLIVVLASLTLAGCRPQTAINSTASPSPSPILFTNTTIAYIADFGDPGEPAHLVADQIAAWNPQWIVTGGDNNYPNGALEDFASNTYAHYEQWIDKHRFLPALGNHDWWKGFPKNNALSYTANELPSCQYFSYLPSCRYYSMRLSDAVEVFVYDSDRREPDGVGLDSKQANWLKLALQNSTARWQIVALHEPPTSSCRHGGSAAVASLPLKDWGTDVLLAGHCHYYERLEWEGLPLMINGAGGGGGLYDFTSISPRSIKRYKGYGFVAITASIEKMTIEFNSLNNSFADELTIQ